MKWFRRYRNKDSSADPNFILKVLLDDEIAKRINLLNSKQRKVFNVIFTWTKDYVKYDGYNIASVPMFHSVSVDTGQ